MLQLVFRWMTPVTVTPSSCLLLPFCQQNWEGSNLQQSDPLSMSGKITQISISNLNSWLETVERDLSDLAVLVIVLNPFCAAVRITLRKSRQVVDDMGIFLRQTG